MEVVAGTEGYPTGGDPSAVSRCMCCALPVPATWATTGDHCCAWHSFHVGNAVPPSAVQCSATPLQDSDDEKTGAVKASGNLFIAVVGAGVLGLPYGEALFCRAGHSLWVLHRAVVSEVAPSASETPAKTGDSIPCSLPAERPGPGRGVPHPGGRHRAVLHAAAGAVQAVRTARKTSNPQTVLQAICRPPQAPPAPGHHPHQAPRAQQLRSCSTAAASILHHQNTLPACCVSGRKHGFSPLLAPQLYPAHLTAQGGCAGRWRSTGW